MKEEKIEELEERVRALEEWILLISKRINGSGSAAKFLLNQKRLVETLKRLESIKLS